MLSARLAPVFLGCFSLTTVAHDLVSRDVAAVDPADHSKGPMHYIPSNVLTTIALVLVLIVAVGQTLCIRRWGAKWMLSMVIAAYCFALGFALRFGLHSNPTSLTLYIVETLFILLSPCGFIAADYMLLGRLALHAQAEKFLLIRPRRITIIFVISDITTFFIQAGGGGLSASKDASMSKLGSNVSLGGLILQLISFALFTFLHLSFIYRVQKYSPAIWMRDQHKTWYARWTTLAYVLCISCAGILVRSVYRTAELSQGYTGKLATTESLFYIFDTLPLLIAVTVYIPFWPGRFLDPRNMPAYELTANGLGRR
ncbi:RTA1 like protein-domain-containing protein [Crucibulum laeve]|uniref:RTA1 like protein-domain-containing protein n=1 Tax=Crucibulum laeve TaxID=68775 RepID=A0A5C3LQA3_9AGAR|nr:RTA1 like protein-domain-containing protein [Crucibulum laeve]